LLLLPFNILLLAPIFAYHFFIQTDHVPAVAFGPKMIAPTGRTAQFSKLPEHISPFDPLPDPLSLQLIF
jgi:hypothetical protein